MVQRRVTAETAFLRPLRRLAPTTVDLAPALGLPEPARVSAPCLEVGTGAAAAARAGLDRLDRPAIVLGGVMLRCVTLGRRTSAALHATGDVMAAGGGEREPFAASWRALAPTRLAVLDRGAMAGVAGFPALSARLAERAIRQADGLGLQFVVSQLVSVEERLRILLPQLADRWGTVTADGVVLPAFLSHTVLAALVGVRRPSLTTALADLVGRGLLSRLVDRRWLLSPAFAGLE